MLLLWWTGLLPVMAIRPEELAGVVDGVDYGRILREIVQAAYWPVTIFAAARVVFDLLRAAAGGSPRLTALGDLAFGAAAAWGHLAMVGLLLQAGYFCFTYLSLKQGMSAGGLALICTPASLDQEVGLALGAQRSEEHTSELQSRY